ncbi:MAG: Sir2 silent information regulator family NAD-dependent deacetylase [bacterium]|nr:Sir2 silent information regulator family NAD-dependent deacetylase [bacterium]
MQIFTTQPSQIAKLKTALLDANTVFLGAGAGLSASAGFTYTGERFQKHFQDFADRYHFTDMYSGGFYPYETLEEHWAYWSRYIFINRFTQAPEPIYDQLFQLLKDKDYFVLTTNVDHQFQRSGFDKQRLFYTQGDYGLFQCSEPCCQKTYDNEMIVHQMVEQQSEMRVPSELVPYCPICGKPMSMNLRADNTFVQDEGWYRASERYEDFVKQHQNRKVLYLELGVGMNTPGIIKYNFWKQVYRNPNATYACINQGQAYVPDEIENRSICIDNDIGTALQYAN